MLVEHNMQVVMGVCEEIHVLDHGETIAHGTPDEIRKHPKVLAAYLGEESGEDEAAGEPTKPSPTGQAEGDHVAPETAELLMKTAHPSRPLPKAEPGAPLLVVEGLEVAYGGIKALKGLSLSVNRGEIVAMIGANGAGKTTTLKTIVRLLPIAAGRIAYDGVSLAGLGTRAGHRRSASPSCRRGAPSSPR